MGKWEEGSQQWEAPFCSLFFFDCWSSHSCLICVSLSLSLTAYFHILSSSSFRVVISDPSSCGPLQPLRKKRKINLYFFFFFFPAVIKNIKTEKNIFSLLCLFSCVSFLLIYWVFKLKSPHLLSNSDIHSFFCLVTTIPLFTWCTEQKWLCRSRTFFSIYAVLN